MKCNIILGVAQHLEVSQSVEWARFSESRVVGRVGNFVYLGDFFLEVGGVRFLN